VKVVKIAVTGANGQLGSELGELAENLPCCHFLFTDIDTLDITDEDAVGTFLTREMPAFLVNCAAYTAVDKAEQEPDRAALLNASGPLVLARCCLSTGTRLLHISTDYVFDGTASIPYTEEDPVNPATVYGRTKREGEVNCLLNPDSLIIRTSWLYSRFGNNFVKTMQGLGKEKEKIRVVFDQVGTPTCAADLAGVILKIIMASVANPRYWKPGLYHFSNEGVCSWYDFACAIFRMAGISCNVEPVESKDFLTLAIRPHFSVLNKSRFKSAFGLEIPYWMDSLEKCILWLKNENRT